MCFDDVSFPYFPIMGDPFSPGYCIFRAGKLADTFSYWRSSYYYSFFLLVVVGGWGGGPKRP